jgi:hypothetical protein
MLAEKFILVLEALLKSSQYPDRSVRVKSTSPHVPVEPTDEKVKREHYEPHGVGSQAYDATFRLEEKSHGRPSEPV